MQVVALRLHNHVLNRLQSFTLLGRVLARRRREAAVARNVRMHPEPRYRDGHAQRERLCRGGVGEVEADVAKSMIDERRRPRVTSRFLPAKDVAVLLAVDIGRAARHGGDVFVPERRKEGGINLY